MESQWKNPKMLLCSDLIGNTKLSAMALEGQGTVVMDPQDLPLPQKALLLHAHLVSSNLRNECFSL